MFLDHLVTRRNQGIPRLLWPLKQAGFVHQPVEKVNGTTAWINGRPILNFVASNYLGLNQHPYVIRAASEAAQSWGVSLSMPRLLAVDRLTSCLETAVARLTGQQQALIFPSTTHISLDLIPLLTGNDGIVFVDEWAYPISLVGVSMAAQKGAAICRFPHNDVQALSVLLSAYAQYPNKVIVCDGFYAAEGHPAHLRAFDRLARQFETAVYVDDTHGIGVLGGIPSRMLPYGRGGGGTLPHLAISSGHMVNVGSLAKAFGIPLAFVAGPAKFVQYMRATAGTMSHCSPPALPVLAAALAALQVHDFEGEERRQRLLQRIRQFRQNLSHTGICMSGSPLSPMQSLYFSSPRTAVMIGNSLQQAGIWHILQFNPRERPAGVVLRFILTALHHEVDVDRLTTVIHAALHRIDGDSSSGSEK